MYLFVVSISHFYEQQLLLLRSVNKPLWALTGCEGDAMLSAGWIVPAEFGGFRDTVQVFLEQAIARCGDGMEGGPMLWEVCDARNGAFERVWEKRLQIERQLQLRYPLKYHRKQKLSAKEEVAQRK
jgi:hypothetical protein